MINTDKINREKRNPNTTHIDSLPTLEMVSLMHSESKRAFYAIDEILPAVAMAVDRIADGFSNGIQRDLSGCFSELNEQNDDFCPRPVLFHRESGRGWYFS